MYSSASIIVNKVLMYYLLDTQSRTLPGFRALLER